MKTILKAGVLLLSFSLLTIASYGQTKVVTVGEMQQLGYNVGAPVHIGNDGSQKIYESTFNTAGKYMTTKRKCKTGVGCCKSGRVSFDETGSIRNVDATMHEQCSGRSIPQQGMMYRDAEDATWVE